MIYQLLILLILHFYWFFVLIRSLVKFVMKGQVVDYQQTINKEKEE